MQHIRWLQIAVLLNPIVYLSEGLRSVLTPQMEHMPVAVVLLVLVGGTALLCWLATRTFTRRVLT
jgi:ABC-2 type transport system permease protein